MKRPSSFLLIGPLLAAFLTAGCHSDKPSTVQILPPNQTKQPAKSDIDDVLTDSDINDPKIANHAEKIADPRLNGLYRATVDETAIPLQTRRLPNYPELLKKAKEDAPTMTFFANASVNAKLTEGPASGFLSKVKGHTVAVLWRSKVAKGQSKIITVPLNIFDDGADFIIDLPGVPSKPLYKKVTDAAEAEKGADPQTDPKAGPKVDPGTP